MRAFVIKRYGGPEALELTDVPKPSPGPGEVLIRVYAAGLNPVDFKMRAGKLRAIKRYTFPLVAGNELSGVVVGKGSGVTRFAEGDRVFTRVDKDKLGAFAEYAVVHERWVAKIPASLDFKTAAGVPLAGLTALQALRNELQVKPGQHIFISGGAGGVGTFAIQLGNYFGAYITTTASGSGKKMVEELGADRVIDYQADKFDQILHDYDGAFDLIGGDTLIQTFGILKRGAKVVSIAGMPEPQTAIKDLQAGTLLRFLFWLISRKIRHVARRYGITYRYLFMHPSGEDLTTLATLIDQQKIKVVIDRVFPFEQIADAFAYLEKGHAKGKVVVELVKE
ncbi:MAG TPA: NADP-dependent oxidoreductase [Bacteroidia bacterium]|nr:NADP-dependent oxidoreductase [Bacteroidia bacterium]